MSVCQLRIENVILIILQLFFAGFIVICLDELLLEVRISSGRCLAPQPSAVVCSICSSSDSIVPPVDLELILSALHEASYRHNLPNVTDLPGQQVHTQLSCFTCRICPSFYTTNLCFISQDVLWNFLVNLLGKEGI
ncbi:hypothetical protein BRADI_1g71490v3 [Brachypodium distachyon]|uniref:Uncharacterized protein n=1 Tax=Brachypodium distachyon TaxID=15368 RepID=I1H8M3_BRADI|nr:hypothetical protein BRADI_1g71490v3 [Brachypodium distachyon]